MQNDSREQSGDASAEETGTDSDEELFAGEGEERRGALNTDAPSVFLQPWLILSCLLIIAAAAFLLSSHTDAAFVALALGVSAWFWNMRVRLKRDHNIKSGRRAESRGSGDAD